MEVVVKLFTLYQSLDGGLLLDYQYAIEKVCIAIYTDKLQVLQDS